MKLFAFLFLLLLGAFASKVFLFPENQDNAVIVYQSEVDNDDDLERTVAEAYAN